LKLIDLLDIETKNGKFSFSHVNANIFRGIMAVAPENFTAYESGNLLTFALGTCAFKAELIAMLLTTP